MKKGKLLLVLLAAIVTAGCSSIRPDDGHDEKIELEPRGYDILGRVHYKGASPTWFMLIGPFGGASYDKLYHAAVSKYGEDVDDVINVTIDRTYTNFLFIYQSMGYSMSGIAVRYHRTPQELGMTPTQSAVSTTPRASNPESAGESAE